MDFFALPEEQAEMLVAAHRSRPMQALGYAFGESHSRIELEYDPLMAALTQPGLTHLGLRIYLRDASVPGDFVWVPPRNPRMKNDISFVESLCVQYYAAAMWQGNVMVGSTGLAGKGWYLDKSLDPAIPRRSMNFLNGRVRRMCPHRAAPQACLEQVRRGEALHVVARASNGALEFHRAGGEWLDRQPLQREYVPID